MIILGSLCVWWIVAMGARSYNEIHNRRVALGITCIQCTPVQLELLRRAGAMPVSSRRCGMITRREAERLVRSFLDDASPPKLPDDFVFDVEHSCGWGCRGAFIPSRYNRWLSTWPVSFSCWCYKWFADHGYRYVDGIKTKLSLFKQYTAPISFWKDI